MITPCAFPHAEAHEFFHLPEGLLLRSVVVDQVVGLPFFISIGNCAFSLFKAFPREIPAFISLSTAAFAWCRPL